MKWIYPIIVVLSLTLPAGAQITIQQIDSYEIENFSSMQNANLEFRNISNINQLGSSNRALVNQSNPSDGAVNSNQAILYQEGDQNTATIDQKGDNNVLLSLQLGYLTNLSFQYDISLLSSSVTGVSAGTAFSFGDISKSFNNLITSSQEGNGNGLITLQIGRDNQITTSQKGESNYLLVTQIGQNQIIQDFKQANQSGFLLESITQLGQSNFIEVTGSVSSQLYGNTYSQSGENLSLQFNSGLLSSVGGLKVTQTGYDMTVIIDQSYFSFPMK